MTPTPEYEIKYFITEERKYCIGQLSDGDKERLITYYKNHKPQQYKDAIRSSMFGTLFLQSNEYPQEAILSTLISVLSLDTLYASVVEKIRVQDGELPEWAKVIS